MFRKGRTPWNKGKTKEQFPQMSRKGINIGRAPSTLQWKGEKVGKAGLHNWINRKLGKPRKCSECGTTTAKKYEWANISGKYKRDLSDYKRLCTKCHHLLDKSGNRKLSEENVLEIRRVFHNTRCPLIVLANRFKVTKTTICEIVNRKTWKHI